MNLNFFEKLFGLFVLFITAVNAASDPASTNYTANATKSAGRNSTATNSTAGGGPQLCHRPLMVSYGLSGDIVSPKEVKLEMCKSVKNSCCTVQDQAAMYRSFKLGGEEEKLKNLVKGSTDAYDALIVSLEGVSDFATRLVGRIGNGTITNCKIMARRLSGTGIKEVSGKIRFSIGEMYKFLQESHKGLYCLLCDAENHQAFSLGRNELALAPGFCSSLTGKAVTPLKYLHIHLAAITNLAARFVQTCGASGEFNSALSLPADAISPDIDAQKVLNQCSRKHKSNTWLEACSKICEAFNPVSFSQFFSPSIDQYKMATTLLNKQLAKITAQEAELNKPKPTTAQSKSEGLASEKKSVKPEKATSQRVLADTKTDKGTEEKAKEQSTLGMASGSQTKNPLIADLREVTGSALVFTPSLEAPINLGGFSCVVRVNGTNPYEAGKNTFIEEEIFKKLPFVPKNKNLANSLSNRGNITTKSKMESGINIESVLVLAFGLTLLWT